ncbi:hypothetical protein SAMN05216368_103363 [Cryobacterium flavum]|uniref:Uncharacterized protein n=1 Tax=Cryobacterium flavum TaxID=1424659 RepID=A0A4R8UXK5_9MICO|nr:hypothetical protein [Cryobacterium flavum]TFB72934.1 hypothetical protein E3O21_17725 [Cryobacterium flavum]SDN07535.1 hypothetical protein SAMN05216368_103363 [Cryobacterium flavum]
MARKLFGDMSPVTYRSPLRKLLMLRQLRNLLRAATAMILVEAIATAVAATLASAVVGRTVAQSGGTDPAVVVLMLTVMGAASVVWLARRAVATDAAP